MLTRTPMYSRYVFVKLSDSALYSARGNKLAHFSKMGKCVDSLSNNSDTFAKSSSVLQDI